MSLRLVLSGLALSVSAWARPHYHAHGHGHKHGRREAGIDQLQNHIRGLRQDVEQVLQGGMSAGKARRNLRDEVRELRVAFDEVDGVKGGGKSLETVLERALSHPREFRPRGGGGGHPAPRPAAHSNRGFSRERWEALREQFGRGKKSTKSHARHSHKKLSPDDDARQTRAALAKRARAHAHQHPQQKNHHARHENRPAYREVMDVPMVVGRDRCGKALPASSLGLKPEAASIASKVWQNSMFLQFAHQAKLQKNGQGQIPVSWAHPGAGVAQNEVDNGRDAHGNLDGVEPFVRVFKDGFYLAGCVADGMLKYGDKFGNGKFSYKEQTNNVSIVLYDQMVLKDHMKPMSPETCFDFCRTMPDMVFFGINNGNTCYCTPFYKPSAEGEGECDVVCPGDEGEMCGGQSKSSVFEMHLCADTANDLAKAAAAAGRVLVYFYENADQLRYFDAEALKSGQTLQKVAGLGGDPAAAALGMKAMQASGDAAKVLKDGECLDAYAKLVAAYDEAKTLKDSDFGKAENLEKADTSIQIMKETTAVVEGCAAKAEDFNSGVYPWFVAYAESKSDEDGGSAWWAKHMSQSFKALEAYKPLIYMMFSQTGMRQTTCAGEIIGHAKVAHYAECAEACDLTVYPTSCLGFQHFTFGADSKPLCFLFKSFEEISEFECDFLTYEDRPWGGLVQTVGGEEPEEEGINCNVLAQSIFFRGSKCSTAEKEACAELCDKAKAAKYSATCDVKVAALSGALPDIPVHKNKRCFGAGENSEDTGGEIEITANEIGGDLDFGTATVVQPTLWTDVE